MSEKLWSRISDYAGIKVSSEALQLMFSDHSYRSYKAQGTYAQAEHYNMGLGTRMSKSKSNGPWQKALDDTMFFI
jgi:hypothetical protein